MSIKFYKTQDPYGCFSNFSRHPIFIDGAVYPTTEHYFQAQKFVGTLHCKEVCLCRTPGDAARMGRRRDLPLRKDWESVKDDIMRKAVQKKVSIYPDVLDLLLKTGTEELIEDSPVDYYWGCGADGSGKNMLGKILMEIRGHLQKYGACRDCKFLVEMCSHPLTDGKPLSNQIGYACIVFYALENGPIVPNWPTGSPGCEMFTKKA